MHLLMTWTRLRGRVAALEDAVTATVQQPHQAFLQEILHRVAHHKARVEPTHGGTGCGLVIHGAAGVSTSVIHWRVDEL